MNPLEIKPARGPNDIVVAMRKPGILLPAYDRETASLAGRTFRIRHRHNAVDEVSDVLKEASMEPHDDDLLGFEAHGATPLPIATTQGFVEHDGVRIRYATYGSGSPVILLHGGRGNGGNWDIKCRRWSTLDVAFCLLTAAAMAAVRAILGASPIR